MKALLLIDIQNDFLPGGALAVRQGDEVVRVANRLARTYDHVVATQDWHPADHMSFASQHPDHKVGDVIRVDGLDQVLWPDHCIQGTPGAEFPRELDQSRVEHVINKGTDPTIDSYSGFFDNARRKSTGLADYLRGRGIDEIHIAGLATDYCVKFTAIDGVDLGFKVVVLSEAVRGVERSPGDCRTAVADMQAAGVTIDADGWE